MFSAVNCAVRRAKRWDERACSAGEGRGETKIVYFPLLPLNRACVTPHLGIDAFSSFRQTSLISLRVVRLRGLCCQKVLSN